MDPRQFPPRISIDAEGATRVLCQALSVLALAAAVLIAVITLRLMVEIYLPMPFWDQWVALTSQEYLTKLFAQHNEHRLVVFRLIAIADNELAGGTYRVSFAMILLLQAAQAALLTAIARWAGLRRSTDVVWAAAIALGFLFWKVQEENFFWAFQTQFIAVYLAGTCAFFALAALSGWKGVVLGGFAGVVAVGSMSNGVLVPPLLVVLAIWLRRPWPQVAALAAIGAVAIGLYLWGYHSPGNHADPLASLRDPLGVMTYAASYLGQPVVKLLSGRQWLAIAGGAVGMAAAAAACLLMLLRPATATPPRLVLLHVVAFIVGTAMLTALGRINFGLEQAQAARYTTPALVFWVALSFLVWSLAAGRWRLLVPVAATLVLAQMLVVSYGSIDVTIRSWRNLRDGGATAMLAGVTDPAEFARVFFDPPRLPGRIELLRRERLALFAEPWSQWLGTPLADHVKTASGGACLGYIDTAEPLPGNPPGTAFRVAGWAWDTEHRHAPDRLVLTDAQGVVVGYALTDTPRPDVREAVPAVREAVPARREAAVGWRGHVKLAAPATVAAYALAPDGKSACLIAGARPLG